MALKLLFSCGVTMPWEDQYRDYLRDYQPEYFYKVEQRAFLPNIFSECRIDNDRITEPLYGFLDLPQIDSFGRKS